jgi:uncharacterized protein (TIRG00374 family)
MRLRSALTWGVTIALAAVLLWLSLRGVEWRRVGESLADARWGPLAVACIAASVVVLLRSERWRILLQAEGALSWRLVFWATSLGYFGNNVLPARAGELLRMRAVAARTKLSNSYVLATALTERSLDAGVLVLASCCALLAVGRLPEWIQGAAGSMAAASFVGIGAILVAPRCECVLNRLLNRMPCGERPRATACRLVSNFLLGMRSFHHGGRAVRFLGLTAVVWSIDGIAAMFVARAISVPLAFHEAMLVVAALALSSALPSTPGAVGVYQFVAVTVMTPLGVSKSGALAFVLLYQGIVLCTLALWGLVGMWRLKVQPRHREEEQLAKAA